ncbi:MAG: hypothetical protein H6581_07010 [Bacteroidia bacterium]|nr:hypothetical protein [Bacteroidia bacterium]
MHKNNRLMKGISLLIVALLMLPGCEGFFGKKTDASFIDEPQFDNKQVAFVPVQPVLDGFVEPVDVVAGYDELLYVVDGGTEEIISHDLAGNEIARFTVPGIKAMAQDRSLDLLALGTLDTVINNSSVKLACIYRIDQKGALGYGLKFAKIVRKVIQPFYYKANFDKSKDPLVNFNGIAIMYDNWYYVTRSGPNKSALYGPDDAVLLFNAEDKFLTTITIQTSSGFFTDYFKSPFGITGLAQPPQWVSDPFREDRDFIFTSTSATTALKVQYIDVMDSDNGISYTVRDLAVGDSSQAAGFLYKPYRFGSALDITYSGDGRNYIFIVDAEKDSLYHFTSDGKEGVQPPAGSNETKNIKVSFGGTGDGLTQFNQPRAVTYLRRILYVADAGNGRVLRFQLTTDFQ